MLSAHATSDHLAYDLVHVEILEPLLAVPTRSMLLVGGALSEVLLKGYDAVPCSDWQLEFEQVLPRQKQKVIDSDLLFPEFVQVVLSDADLLQDVSELVRICIVRHYCW